MPAKKTAKSEPVPGVIEVSETDIIRFGFSRAKVKKVLEKLNPIRVDGRARLYDCGQVVMAIIGSDETDEDRKKRIDADIAEEKLKRLRGESIDLRKARDMLADMLRMGVEAVRAESGLDEAAKQKVLKVFRTGATRLVDNLDGAKFDAHQLEVDPDE